MKSLISMKNAVLLAANILFSLWLSLKIRGWMLRLRANLKKRHFARNPHRHLTKLPSDLPRFPPCALHLTEQNPEPKWPGVLSKELFKFFKLFWHFLFLNFIDVSDGSFKKTCLKNEAGFLDINAKDRRNSLASSKHWPCWRSCTFRLTIRWPLPCRRRLWHRFQN